MASSEYGLLGLPTLNDEVTFDSLDLSSMNQSLFKAIHIAGHPYSTFVCVKLQLTYSTHSKGLSREVVCQNLPLQCSLEVSLPSTNQDRTCFRFQDLTRSGCTILPSFPCQVEDVN